MVRGQLLEISLCQIRYELIGVAIVLVTLCQALLQHWMLERIVEISSAVGAMRSMVHRTIS